MQALREITVWEGDAQPNHVYLMDGDKAVAYIKHGSDQPFYFTNPMRIDKRGRKFEKLDTNPFEISVESTTIEVQGSNGAVYYVDPETKTCTCKGFEFRGTCRHLKDLQLTQ